MSIKDSKDPHLVKGGDSVQIDSKLADDAILQEIGDRLAQRRLDRQLSQAQLAEQSGLAKRTVERIEAGESTQLLSLIRVLRVLDLLEAMEAVFPANAPRPLDLLELKGRKRRRVSTSRKTDRPWRWDEEK